MREVLSVYMKRLAAWLLGFALMALASFAAGGRVGLIGAWLIGYLAAEHDADRRTRQARDAAGICSAARHDFHRVLGCRADLDRGVLYGGFGLCSMLRRDDAPHHAARARNDR